jgi:hypothetical protein
MHRKFAFVIGSALLAGFAQSAPSYAQEQKPSTIAPQQDQGMSSNMNKMMDECGTMMMRSNQISRIWGSAFAAAALVPMPPQDHAHADDRSRD